MGGSTNPKFPRIVRDRTPLLFDGIGYENLSTSQSVASTQAEYVSENTPSYFAGSTQGEATRNVLVLFLIMYYILKEKFKNIKNKKMCVFLSKLENMELIDENSLINNFEFKKFQEYCGNKSIQQYDDYDIARKYMTKYFHDTSGTFMKMKKSDWVQYTNKVLKMLKKGNNNANNY
jgi:hypothetical protein